jgi:hypothetical protein
LGVPIIVVTFNYRLNILGFGDYGEKNLALKDQRSAIEWVTKHIAEFGGDKVYYFFLLCLGKFPSANNQRRIISLSQERVQVPSIYMPISAEALQFCEQYCSRRHSISRSLSPRKEEPHYLPLYPKN